MLVLVVRCVILVMLRLSDVRCFGFILIWIFFFVLLKIWVFFVFGILCSLCFRLSFSWDRMVMFFLLILV